MRSTDRIKIVLRNPLTKDDFVDYEIIPNDTQLATDWVKSLREDILRPKLHLEKNYCFLGFPNTHRTVEYLCSFLNQQIKVINLFNETNVWQSAGLKRYRIEEWFCKESVCFHDADYPVGVGKIGLFIKHDIMNRLHNHFERLQGTVWEPSMYYELASPEVRYAITQLNLVCHEIESLVKAIRKAAHVPESTRPSQITTFTNAPRHLLSDEHRKNFTNGFDKKLGGVYMHWCQIGKTLMEVYEDEGAPDLNVGDDPLDISVGAGTTCEAINALRYYSGEFDIQWANDVVYDKDKCPQHVEQVDGFFAWLDKNGVDRTNPKLSLGYLPIANIDLQGSFGTVEAQEIWKILESHLDIYRIEVGNDSATYDYNWTDDDYVKRQIALLQR